MRDVKRPALRRLAIVALLLGVVFLARSPILASVARFMTLETPITRADAIVPLYQDPATIPAAAVAWLQRGYAKQVIVYRPKLSRIESLGLRPAPDVIMRRLLEAQGTAPDKIVEIGHDIENQEGLVEALAGFLGKGTGKRVIVVASAPRSRLTWMALHGAMARAGIDLQLDAVSATGFDERTWWKTRDGVITYFDAYCLWLLRFVR